MAEDTGKKTITYDEYLKLKGLEILAKEHYEQLNYIEKAVLKITEEEEGGGHSADFIFGYRELDEMLRILNIEVEKE